MQINALNLNSQSILPDCKISILRRQLTVEMNLRPGVAPFTGIEFGIDNDGLYMQKYPFRRQALNDNVYVHRLFCENNMFPATGELP